MHLIQTTTIQTSDNYVTGKTSGSGGGGIVDNTPPRAFGKTFDFKLVPNDHVNVEEKESDDGHVDETKAPNACPLKTSTPIHRAATVHDVVDDGSRLLHLVNGRLVFRLPYAVLLDVDFWRLTSSLVQRKQRYAEQLATDLRQWRVQRRNARCRVHPVLVTPPTVFCAASQSQPELRLTSTDRRLRRRQQWHSRGRHLIADNMAVIDLAEIVAEFVAVYDVIRSYCHDRHVHHHRQTCDQRRRCRCRQRLSASATAATTAKGGVVNDSTTSTATDSELMTTTTDAVETASSSSRTSSSLSTTSTYNVTSRSPVDDGCDVSGRPSRKPTYRSVTGATSSVAHNDVGQQTTVDSDSVDQWHHMQTRLAACERRIAEIPDLERRLADAMCEAELLQMQLARERSVSVDVGGDGCRADERVRHTHSAGGYNDRSSRKMKKKPWPSIVNNRATLTEMYVTSHVATEQLVTLTAMRNEVARAIAQTEADIMQSPTLVEAIRLWEANEAKRRTATKVSVQRDREAQRSPSPPRPKSANSRHSAVSRTVSLDRAAAAPTPPFSPVVAGMTGNAIARRISQQSLDGSQVRECFADVNGSVNDVRDGVNSRRRRFTDVSDDTPAGAMRCSSVAGVATQRNRHLSSDSVSACLMFGNSDKPGGHSQNVEMRPLSCSSSVMATLEDAEVTTLPTLKSLAGGIVETRDVGVCTDPTNSDPDSPAVHTASVQTCTDDLITDVPLSPASVVDVDEALGAPPDLIPRSRVETDQTQHQTPQVTATSDRPAGLASAGRLGPTMPAASSVVANRRNLTSSLTISGEALAEPKREPSPASVARSDSSEVRASMSGDVTDPEVTPRLPHTSSAPVSASKIPRFIGPARPIVRSVSNLTRSSLTSLSARSPSSGCRTPMVRSKSTLTPRSLAISRSRPPLYAQQRTPSSSSLTSQTSSAFGGTNVIGCSAPGSGKGFARAASEPRRYAAAVNNFNSRNKSNCGSRRDTGTLKRTPSVSASSVTTTTAAASLFTSGDDQQLPYPSEEALLALHHMAVVSAQARSGSRCSSRATTGTNETATMTETTSVDSVRSVAQREWFRLTSRRDSVSSDIANYILAVINWARQHHVNGLATSDDSYATATPVTIDDTDSYVSAVLSALVNMTDVNGNTALHYATSFGNYDVVSGLLASRPATLDANIVNRAGYTAAMLVPLAPRPKRPAHFAVVERLLRASDMQIAGRASGQTALMLAAIHDRADVVQLIVTLDDDRSRTGDECEKSRTPRSGPRLIDAQDVDGSTALMCGVQHGHPDVVTALLNGQPRLDIVDCEQLDALAIARAAAADAGSNIDQQRRRLKVIDLVNAAVEKD